MDAGGWGGSEMPCIFKALQLQRFESRMFQDAAGQDRISSSYNVGIPMGNIETLNQSL